MHTFNNHLLSLYLLLISLPLLSSMKNEFIEQLQKEQVQFANLLFTDIHGNLKEITIPIKHIAGALEQGLAFDGSSVAGCSHISDSDMFIKPDLSTARIIPWFGGINKIVVLLCDVYKNVQEEHSGDPRCILKTVMQEAADLGYVFNVGPELEFFLMKKDELAPADKLHYCAAETNVQHFIHKSSLVHALLNMDIDIEKLHHEVASGQHEVTFKYGNALNIADQIVLTKFALQSVAKEYGYHASFMPKPFEHENGSAMHIHFSLWDNLQQKNAFCTSSDYKLSDIGQQFIAGVLYHINDLAAIFNPAINSYKRLFPGYEAPTYVCWGTKNRSALIRIPQVNAQRAVRAEIRCPDPLCNPYLAFAALLKAGLDGIKKKRPLMQPVEKNVYKLTPEECKALHIAALPSCLGEALYNLQHSCLAAQLMGTKTLDQYVSLKREEVSSYNKHISQWELQRYL